jgi:hypothetical protein
LCSLLKVLSGLGLPLIPVASITSQERDVLLPPGKSGSCAGLFCTECLHVIAGVVLELLDQKARGFLVLIALKRLFSEHDCKLFGEMSVRT